MSRTIWKGAISFGLVHVPIVVHPGARSARLNFDWIDKRDHAPVGYQRINKRTGKVIDSEHIVKGYEYERGEYVFMSDADFDNANIAATQTIELLDFVNAADVPLYYFDAPYYLAPDKRGDKGYALLRDVLIKSKRIGLANVVLHTKQHLAAVMPMGDVLVMMTMRYANEILPMDELEVPSGKGKQAPSKAEVDMALRLVDSMTRPFDAERYTDSYRDDLMAAINKKIKAGKTHELTEASAPTQKRESAQIIDLMAVLKRSVEGRGTKPSARKASAATSEKAASSKRNVATTSSDVKTDAPKAGRSKGTGKTRSSKDSTASSAKRTSKKAQAAKPVARKQTASKAKQSPAAKKKSPSSRKSASSTARTATPSRKAA